MAAALRTALTRGRRSARAHDAEPRFRALIDATSDLVYDMSPDRSEMHIRHGHGFLADTCWPRTGWMETYILPEDHATVRAAVDEAVRAETVFQLEHRMRRADGSVGVVGCRAGAGALTGWFGATSDIGQSHAVREAQARSEQRYRALFDAIDDGFCIIEFIDSPNGPLSDYSHIEANDGYERHTGIAGIVGQRQRTGVPVRFAAYFARAGRHIEVSTPRVEPASLKQVVLFRDIVARKKTQEALRASEAIAQENI